MAFHRNALQNTARQSLALPLWQAPCLKPFVDYEWRLRAAAGYAELGMSRELITELNAIEKPAQDRPEVLQLRFHHLMREKKWERGSTVSSKLCLVAPYCIAGFLHAGFWLHELGKSLEAKELLLKRSVALLPRADLLFQHGLLRRASRAIRSQRRSICSPVSKWILHSVRSRKRIPTWNRFRN